MNIKNAANAAFQGAKNSITKNQRPLIKAAVKGTATAAGFVAAGPVGAAVAASVSSAAVDIANNMFASSNTKLPSEIITDSLLTLGGTLAGGALLGPVGAVAGAAVGAAVGPTVFNAVGNAAAAVGSAAQRVYLSLIPSANLTS